MVLDVSFITRKSTTELHLETACLKFNEAWHSWLLYYWLSKSRFIATGDLLHNDFFHQASLYASWCSHFNDRTSVLFLEENCVNGLGNRKC